MTVLKGIIFDMDGVLCDSETFICEAACRMFLETYQSTVSAADFIPFVGAGEDRYLGGVAEQHGITLTMPRDKNRTYAIYLEMIQGRLEGLPGAVTFIERAKKSGLKLAVATSADRVKMEGNLKEIGLPQSAFIACITGSEVTHKKPDPEIFIKAAQLIGLAPAACLVVEDAVNGVQAARAAGCHCLGLTTSFDNPTLIEAGAHWSAPDLNTIPKETLSCLGL